MAQWLGASNSCVNPILYFFFNVKFRAYLKMAITRKLLCSSSEEYTRNHIYNNNHTNNGHNNAFNNSSYHNNLKSLNANASMKQEYNTSKHDNHDGQNAIAESHIDFMECDMGDDVMAADQYCCKENFIVNGKNLNHKLTTGQRCVTCQISLSDDSLSDPKRQQYAAAEQCLYCADWKGNISSLTTSPSNGIKNNNHAKQLNCYHYDKVTFIQLSQQRSLLGVRLSRETQV